MTPEQLCQIEELYHAARQDREVLRSADAELRREVESLLAHEHELLPNLSASVTAEEDLRNEHGGLEILPGTQLGPYIIEGPLGEGGMGVVYRARDSKLNRPVAVKFLSTDRFDISAHRRFHQETRLASSLNHPHILTVYDTGDYEGRPYLVTEFVDGGTLKDWIKGEKRTWRQIVELLAGVADGLAAAHNAGILHRDIKPANILVATNGYAKLADFGLAKLAESPAIEPNRTLSAEHTGPGFIVATIAYMSPEQAAGQPADARSDIFSFGVVLYEMLTGRRPFAGGTDAEFAQAILHATPGALPGDVPVNLATTVEKALEKDPAERYQTARDLVVDLRRAVRRKLDDPPLKTVKPALRVPLWAWAMLGALIVAAAVAVAVIVWRIGRVPPALENPLANAIFTRLTDYEGTEVDASISPDGKFVAFLSDRTGHFSAWLVRIGAGMPINLTPGPEDQRAPLRSIGFSPEGSEIWLSGTDSRKIRMVPLVGGEPRVFLGEKAVSPVWSPDGARLAYHSLDAGDPIFVADRDGGNARQIFRDRPDKHNHYLAWAADGQHIYFVHGTPATKDMDLWEISASGGTPERLTQLDSEMSDPTPLGDKTVLYVARQTDGSGPWIWAYDVVRKSSRRITFGLEKYTSLSASADGKRLAVTLANPKAGLWSVPISDSVAAESDAKPFTLPSARALAPRFRENTLYYLSSQGAGDSLWRFEAGKTTEIWRETQGGLLQPPAVSPDGRRIAIVIRKEGKGRLRVLAADGSQSSTIGPDFDVEGSSDWSPDGKWIVTGGNDGKGAGLFKIPSDGGTPVRLSAKVARNPVWSPAGDLIVYSGPNVFTLTPVLAMRPDGTPVKIPEIKTHRDGERLRFLPTGRGLVYMQGEGATPWQDFWLLDLKTMKTRRLTRFSDRATMRTFDVSPDGKSLIFDRQRENSSAVLIDLQVKPQ